MFNGYLSADMEGGRNVSGERHDEGKGRVSTQGGAGREGQNSITCVGLKSWI